MNAFDWPTRQSEVRDAGGEVWTPYALPERIEYPNWSRDGRHIYGVGTGGRLVRLELASGRLETVAETDAFRLGHGWTSLTPDDSPMVLRDLSSGTSAVSIGRRHRMTAVNARLSPQL